MHGFHLDLYGHVNNTRYLEFLEEARWHIKETYWNFPAVHDDGYGLVVVRNVINYRHPAKSGDILNIRSKILQTGRTSAVISHKIFLNDTDTLVLDAEVTFVLTDRKSGKSVPLTDEWRHRFNLLKSDV